MYHLSTYVVTCFSCVPRFASPWLITCQAPLSIKFFRQEYWSGLPCPAPGDLPNLRIKSVSSEAPALQVDSLPPSHWGSPATYFSPKWYLKALALIPVTDAFWNSSLTKEIFFFKYKSSPQINSLYFLAVLSFRTGWPDTVQIEVVWFVSCLGSSIRHYWFSSMALFGTMP